LRGFTECGDVCVTVRNTLSYTFKNVRYVPNMNKNLLSISETNKNPKHCVNFQGNKCIVSSLHDDKVIAVGIGEKGLYKLVDLKTAKTHGLVAVENTNVLWHERYGHLSY
jgi:hypothetical protein